MYTCPALPWDILLALYIDGVRVVGLCLARGQVIVNQAIDGAQVGDSMISP